MVLSADTSVLPFALLMINAGHIERTLLVSQLDTAEACLKSRTCPRTRASLAQDFVTILKNHSKSFAWYRFDGLRHDTHPFQTDCAACCARLQQLGWCGAGEPIPWEAQPGSEE